MEGEELHRDAQQVSDCLLAELHHHGITPYIENGYARMTPSLYDRLSHDEAGTYAGARRPGGHARAGEHGSEVRRMVSIPLFRQMLKGTRRRIALTMCTEPELSTFVRGVRFF